MRWAANLCLTAKAAARARRRCRGHVGARTWRAPGLQTRSGGAGVPRQPVRHSSPPSAPHHAEPTANQLNTTFYFGCPTFQVASGEKKLAEFTAVTTCDDVQDMFCHQQRFRHTSSCHLLQLIFRLRTWDEVISIESRRQLERHRSRRRHHGRRVPTTAKRAGARSAGASVSATITARGVRRIADMRA